MITLCRSKKKTCRNEQMPVSKGFDLKLLFQGWNLEEGLPLQRPKLEGILSAKCLYSSNKIELIRHSSSPTLHFLILSRALNHPILRVTRVNMVGFLLDQLPEISKAWIEEQDQWVPILLCLCNQEDQDQCLQMLQMLENPREINQSMEDLQEKSNWD